MRVTRSASAASIAVVQQTTPVKRSAIAPQDRPVKRTKSLPATPQASAAHTVPLATPSSPRAVEHDTAAETEGILMHPKMIFSFEDARRHLIRIDTRWEPLMDKLKCTPFQEESETPFNPFR